MPDSAVLYLDEDSQRAALVRALRSRQVEVVACNEARLQGTPDEVQLDYAAANGLVLFTFNRGDFVHLHTRYMNEGRSHTGIIVSDQLETGVIFRRLLQLIHTRSAEEMRNGYEFLSNWR